MRSLTFAALAAFSLSACVRQPVAALPSSMVESSEEKGLANRRAPAAFADFDEDGDGSLDRAEYLGAVLRRFTPRDKDNNGLLSGAEFGSGRGYQRADTNRDGNVSEAEFLRASEAAFRRADKNRDGKLKQDDFARAAGNLLL